MRLFMSADVRQRCNGVSSERCFKWRVKLNNRKKKWGGKGEKKAVQWLADACCEKDPSLTVTRVEALHLPTFKGSPALPAAPRAGPLGWTALNYPRCGLLFVIEEWNAGKIHIFIQMVACTWHTVNPWIWPVLTGSQPATVHRPAIRSRF